MFAVGTDIIEIGRIKKAMEKRSSFKNRVFTCSEQEYCESRGNPYAHYAARFAGKEAVVKCLGKGLRGLSWQEIEIKRDKFGGPRIILRGRALEMAKSMGFDELKISLSHSKDFATAVVLAIGGDKT